MKRLGVMLTVAVLIGVFFLMTNIHFINAGDPFKDDLMASQNAAQTFVSSLRVVAMYPAWKNASVADGQACYDLKDRVIAFLFYIIKEDREVGRIVVGSSAYSYRVLEASQALIPSPPTASELINIIDRASCKIPSNLSGIGDKVPCHRLFLRPYPQI